MRLEGNVGCRLQKNPCISLMEFAIKRRPPLSLMALVFINFLPYFFPFAIESYLYETNFTPGPIQNYHSYNWFKY